MRNVKSAFALLLTKVTKRLPSLTASGLWAAGCIGVPIGISFLKKLSALPYVVHASDNA